MSQRIVNNITAALVDKQGVDLTDREDNMFASDVFVINGGTLTYDYDTETKISGQLDMSMVNVWSESNDFSSVILKNYIKIYINDAKLGRKKLLATMLPSVKDIEDTKGYIFTGSLELKSTLAALTENKVRKTSLKKGTNIYKKFCQYAKNYACEGLTTVVSNIGNEKKSLTFKKNKVFQSGTTVYEIMNYMARLMGAYITVNAKGQIYLKLKKGPINWYEFDAARFGNSKRLCMTSTITVTDNSTPINRMIATFEKTENKTTTRHYSKPVILYANNPYSRQNLGRNITDIIKVSEEELKDRGAKLNDASSIKSKLTAIAKDELLEACSYNYAYTFKCPYVDEIKLRDKIDIYLQVDVVEGARISAFDIDLSNGCEMTITCNTANYVNVKTQTGKSAKL